LLGAYTFLLPPDAAPPSGVAYPPASGYGTLTVAATGRVTAKIYLADGSPTLTAAGIHTATGDFYFDLPKLGGVFLAGSMVLEEGAGDSVTGTVTWQRLGQGAPVHIAVQGSRYRPPAGAQEILVTPLTFHIAGGAINDPAAQPIALSAASDKPANKVTFAAGGALKTLTMAPKTGLLNGSFGAGVPGVVKPGTFSFRGVVLQKQNRAEGFFKGPVGTGAIGSVIIE
jgi:hypothetical protein